MMTKILKFTLVLILLSAAKISAQTATYHPRENTDVLKVLGIWTAKAGKENVRLTFKDVQHKYIESLDVYTDVIEGRYSVINHDKSQIEEMKNVLITHIIVTDYDKNEFEASYIDTDNQIHRRLILKVDPVKKNLRLIYADERLVVLPKDSAKRLQKEKPILIKSGTFFQKQ